MAWALLGSSQVHANLVEVNLISNDAVEVREAIFEWVDSTTVTNGQLLPFLQVSGIGVAGDYNRKKSIVVKDVPVVTLNGTNYLQFALDIQGTAVSLDTIEIFTGGMASLGINDLGALGVKRWDLDKSCWNYEAEAGSGCGPSWEDAIVQCDPHRNIRQSGIDIFLYVPASNFEGALPTDRVYFFCVFGNPLKPFPSSIPMHPKGRGTMKWGILKPLPVR